MHVDLKKSGFYYFDNQNGDILNLFKKRGFGVLMIEGIKVFNTHLSNCQMFFETKVDIDNLSNRYDQIKQLIRETNSSDTNVICGDFNCDADSPDLIEMNNLFTSTCKCYTWAGSNSLTDGFHKVRDHQSDYIFVNNAFILSAEMVMCQQDVSLSDHYGVLVDIKHPSSVNSFKN